MPAVSLSMSNGLINAHLMRRCRRERGRQQKLEYKNKVRAWHAPIPIAVSCPRILDH